MRPHFLVVFVALAACSSSDHQARQETAGMPDSASSRGGAETAPADPGLKLPGGFRATVYADSLGQARHIAVADNGDLYVNTWPSDTTRPAPQGGNLVALRDTNRDGEADLIRRFGPTGPGEHGGTGLALYQGSVYAESGPTILRWKLPSGGLAPEAPPDTIVTGMPTKGGHTMHPFVISPSGDLFVDIGSATNSCQVEDRETGSPGERPCKELEGRAGIWRFSAERTGQRYSRGARYATGIRNAEGFAIHPGDRALFATQHGRDQLFQNWPKLFTAKQGAELPAEELLRVQRGGDYGWPYCYFDQDQGRLVLAPEYGGDGKKVGECAQKLGPAAAYPGHWAPMALLFYTGGIFPEKYRNGVFIAFHGSWNRAPEAQAGYNVVFQPFAEGRPQGGYEVFADGFAGGDKQPERAAHRPTGLAQGPDGAVYVSDDAGGRVWRITYQAER
jgi:glucose/arabinose dehydrogenase